MSTPLVTAFGKKIALLFGIALLVPIVVCSCVQEDERNAYRIRKGAINLSAFAFDEKRTVALEGDWFFWPDCLLSPEDVSGDLAIGYNKTTPVPGEWSEIGPFGDIDALTHTGTLALELTLPADGPEWALRLPNADSACKLFVDGVEAAHIGTVGESEETSIPNNGLEIIHFRAHPGKTLLVLQVSNFHTPYTGTWDGPVLGTFAAITAKRNSDIAVTALIGGALLLIGLYHLVLYRYHRENTSPLLFGIICVLMSTRCLIMGERLLLACFPQTALGWEIAFKVEHLSAHMVLPLFFVYFRQLFPREVRKIPERIVLAGSALWAALEIFTPAIVHHRFLSTFEYFLLVSALYMLCAIILAQIRRESGATVVLAGLSVLILTVINDVLLSNGIIKSFYMTSLGAFVFLFSQAILIARNFSELYRTVKRYANELQTLNQSLERFIPHEVLGFLGKRSIVDVGLGDFSEENMSVFFLDIRDFTSLSESMTPNETFRFINSFLERMGPIVRENDGFIDKYMGDGIMALFPGDPDRALDAALEMRRELIAFNADHPDLARPIRFGIGIHRGPLMLGTIGENQRMDSTVISDTVNTASRLEQLTKTHKTDILVSAETIRDLANPEQYRWSVIGSETVKGRKQAVDVFALESGPEKR